MHSVINSKFTNGKNQYHFLHKKGPSQVQLRPEQHGKRDGRKRTKPFNISVRNLFFLLEWKAGTPRCAVVQVR